MTHTCKHRHSLVPCTCGADLHVCWHCHDDPPAGHTCPCCGARPKHETPAAITRQKRGSS